MRACHRGGERDPAAVSFPEPADVPIVDPGDTRGRVEQLAQVLPAPAVGPETVLGQAMEVDQDQSDVGRIVPKSLEIKVKVAKIQVFVEYARRVQGSGDPGHLGDQPPLERLERSGLQLVRQFGQGDVQFLAAGKLGHHQVALQAGPRTDALAGRHHLGNRHTEGSRAFKVDPFGSGRRVSPGRIEERG